MLLEAQEQAERCKEEWSVEREISALPPRQLVMPWMRIGEEDDRFRKSAVLALLWSLLFALWAPLIQLPIPEPELPSDVPERLTRLIMERREPPPAEAVISEPEPPKPELAAETPAEQTARPKEGPGAGPGEGPGKGILAFREKFSGFAENQAIARLGSQARISSPGRRPACM